MPQYPVNIPAPSQLSTVITTNTTTAIQTGRGAQLTGYVCSNAGSAWTLAFYNGDPSGTGVQVGPTVTAAAGFFSYPAVAFPNGLYVVTAGTTAGSVQIAFH